MRRAGLNRNSKWKYRAESIHLISKALVSLYYIYISTHIKLIPRNLNMDASVEELFSTLKDVTKKGQSSAASNDDTSARDSLDHDTDVVYFENENATFKRDTEEEFKKIEETLKSLPKLRNEFDILGRNTSTNKKTVSSMRESSIKLASSAEALPTQMLSRKDQKKKEEEEKEKKDWFLLPKPSDDRKREVQRDLLLIKHRAALDPKRHYKKQKWVFPERFSVGTIVEPREEFYSSRITKKNRKSTILESLMTDEDTNKYFKRKYEEIQIKKASGKKGYYNKRKAMRRGF